MASTFFRIDCQQLMSNDTHQNQEQSKEHIWVLLRLFCADKSFYFNEISEAKTEKPDKTRIDVGIKQSRSYPNEYDYKESRTGVPQQHSDSKDKQE